MTPHLRVALLEPDIPQNTGTILRLAACLGVEAHIIEPAGFPTTDRAFRRAGMDYLDQVDILRHPTWEAFEAWRSGAVRAADPFHHARPVVLSRPRVSARRCPAVRPRIVGRGQTRSTRPPTHGWSFRCGKACARSMWRWQRPWRWARRSDRSTPRALKPSPGADVWKHEAGERQYTPRGVAPHPHRSLGACRHPPLAKSPRKRGYDIALPDPPHAQLFPKQWQKKAQLQFSPVLRTRAPGRWYAHAPQVTARRPCPK